MPRLASSSRSAPQSAVSSAAGYRQAPQRGCQSTITPKRRRCFVATRSAVDSPSRVQAALDRLLAVPAHRFAVKPLMHETWRLRHNLTIADALYVVVAQHLGAELVTTDLRLANGPGLPVATITP